MWPIRQICNNRTWMERELQHQLGGRITAEWVKFVYICMYLVQINVCMGKHISTLWRKKAPVNAECRRKFTQCRVSCVGQNIFENLFSLRWTCLVLVHLRGKLPRIYKLDGTTSNALKWNIVWALSLVPQTLYHRHSTVNNPFRMVRSKNVLSATSRLNNNLTVNVAHYY